MERGRVGKGLNDSHSSSQFHNCRASSAPDGFLWLMMLEKLVDGEEHYAHRCLSCKDHREVFRLFQKCLIRTNMRKMEEHLLSISGKKNFLLPLFPDFFSVQKDTFQYKY